MNFFNSFKDLSITGGAVLYDLKRVTSNAYKKGKKEEKTSQNLKKGKHISESQKKGGKNEEQITGEYWEKWPHTGIICMYVPLFILICLP